MGDERIGAVRWRRALVVVVAVVVAAACSSDNSTSGGPTTSSAWTSSSTSTSMAPVREPTVVWPPPGVPSFASAADAAKSFAIDYLGFRDPLIGELRQGDSRSGEIDVRPTARGPVMTVLVRQVSGETGWSVLGSATEHIVLDEPASLTTVASPLTIRGRGVAFEGNILVEVRDDVSVEPLGSGFVTAGGDVLRPFESSISFLAPRSRGGAIVLRTESAEDGRMWEAVVVRVAFAEACGVLEPAAGPDPDEMAVTVFFSCDVDGFAPSVRPVARLVPRSPRVLSAALRSLVAGPTRAEREASLSSWFSSETKDSVRQVTIAGGHAVVDFVDLRPLIGGASSSAGSARLLAELDATVFQFPTVTSAEYRLEGSCEEFTEWLQFGGCDPRRRPGTGR